MSLSVAVQMDHISKIHIRGDSTFALMLEGQKRGHTLYHYTPDRLSLNDGRVEAMIEPVQVRDLPGDHFSLGEAERADLSTFDAVLMRQDPPFDMGYITTTHLLERIHPKTLVVNDPAHVRNAPEKIFVTEYPALMPPTLISRDPDEIRRFRNEHGDIIIKPLFGNGGAGVFRLSEGDQNLGSLLEIFAAAYRGEPYVVQRYLPDVRAGDKRIILVDGVAVGAINRVPADGEARSNMHVGGRPEPIELTRRDREICEAIGPELKARGFIFVGIDVIGDYLTEINVTSPTGIREVKRFGGADIAALVWDAIEARR
ncbi:glutathione synthase [Kaistia dalseonensis]|uniref:Glutathione synthetase n=1 Tax=Kaistia dalseonensis TaxID=410840 RepID=A0ABU0H564_9HYPH|nr:glutathione synthase [Kaistia dalseonensis]MCX5494867.1 glutathione synthase [Kaistia dalseonensis]MDQ0437448.1 glutathione synthase [Kaistia dalseonensis]